ncbi:MAG: hypothetical protein WCF12_08830 [Propionicimonas sp.]
MSVGAMDDLAGVLARHGVPMSSSEVVASLDAAFAEVSRAGAAPLSASETEFLRAHGGPRASEVLDQWDPAAEDVAQARAAVRRVAAAAQATMSIAEAALLLGVDRSRISHRLAQGSLWAFSVGRTRRIPRWQFTTDGRLLPGLAVVVASIPDGLAPRSVEAFITTPQPELDGRTPAVHLADGGDPRPVAGLLADLGVW